MKQAITILSLVFLLLIVGCDPGMTIRQVVQPASPGGSPAVSGQSNVSIAVKASDALIGETWYAPSVTVTNSLASPITINAVELTAKNIVYTNDLQNLYPVVVRSGQTEPLRVSFDLREDVWKTFFKQSADLRVSYVSNGQKMTVRANIIGERLDHRVS